MEVIRKKETQLAEILAVLLTGFGKFVFMDMWNLRLLYISLAVVGWSVYVAYRYHK